MQDAAAKTFARMKPTGMAMLAFLCGCTATTAVDTASLFLEGMPGSREAVADYDSMSFTSEGSEIYGQILKPDRSYGARRPCVMFFHGFAGFARFDDVAQALCRAGCVVVVPHHRGAWGSQGTYSITHCIQDAVNLVRFAQSDAFRRKYDADSGSLFLVGHSMGGNTVLNAAGQIAGVRGIVLLDPCDIGATAKAMDYGAFQDFLVENGLEVLRTEGVGAICRDVLDHADEYAFPVAAARLNGTSVLWVEATWGLDESGVRKKAFVRAAERNENIPRCDVRSYPCKHGLMGVRLNVARDIANFVNGCCARHEAEHGR